MTSNRRPAVKPSAEHERRTRRDQIARPPDLGQRAESDLLLEELGVPYVREDYGRQFGNTTTDEYRKLNPNAKVPTLIDGEW